MSDQPRIGSPRPELGRDVRMRVIAPYLMFYRHADGATTVLRILHGRRRITAILLKRANS